MLSSDPAILFRDLQAAMARRDGGQVAAIVRRLVALDPPLGQRWRAVATLARHEGEVDAARFAIARYAADQRHSPAALFDQAAILAQTGAPGEALKLLDDVPPTVPDRAGHAYVRGTLAMNLGEVEKARAHLSEAVVARPALGQAWLALAAVTAYRGDPAAAARLADAAPAFERAPPGERAQWLYALGKMLDETGEPDGAFAAFAEGAALVARERPHDDRADADGAAAAMDGWTAERIAAVGRTVDAPSGRAIVVTGLPRSGTTLVEQILASHSAVIGGEELGRFAPLARQAGGVRFADWEAAARRGVRADTISRAYLRLAGQRFGGEGRFIDKTLDASRTLGLFAATMPDAPLIWVRRPALDCAWSCFRTYFLRGVTWSWSLPAIARHMALEDRLAARWREVLGDRLLFVDYAALVDDPATVVPSLAAHAGLAMEPGMLTPEKTERPVVTASVMQVRAPINRGGLGQAERYRAHLQPFVDAYRALGGTIN